MLQYEWEIVSLYTTPTVDNLSNVVKRVTWRYQVKEDSNVADIYGDTYFNSINAENFIAYDNLTKETVVLWIESIEDVSELKQNLISKLNEVKAPSIIEKQLPWDFESRYSFSDKYILIHNNELVAGPIYWNSNILNQHLKTLNIKTTLPEDILARKQGIVPLYQPTIVNENTKIYKAVTQNEQPEESIFTNNGNIDWNFSSGIAVGTYNAVDKPLNEVKEILKDIVLAAREEKAVKGAEVTINGNTYKAFTAPFARILLLQKLVLMSDSETCVWQFMNNEWAQVSKSNLLDVLREIDTYIQGVIEWQQDLVQRIESSSSIESLKTITIN